MATIDLTDVEHTALAALIRRAIEDDRFPPRPSIRCAPPCKLDPAAGLGRPLTPKSPKPQSPHSPKAAHEAPEGKGRIARSFVLGLRADDRLPLSASQLPR